MAVPRHDKRGAPGRPLGRCRGLRGGGDGPYRCSHQRRPLAGQRRVTQTPRHRQPAEPQRQRTGLKPRRRRGTAMGPLGRWVRRRSGTHGHKSESTDEMMTGTNWRPVHSTEMEYLPAETTVLW